MSNQTDTVAGVLAEMRADMDTYSEAMPLTTVEQWADRLAAAHEREVGELREKLANMSDGYLDASYRAQQAEAADALLREVVEKLRGIGCEPCIGSMVPFEDLHGRITTHLGAPR